MDGFYGDSLFQQMVNIPAHRLQDHIGKVNDKACLLCNGNEFRRINRADRRMVHPHQGFGKPEVPGIHGINGLIVQLYLFFRQLLL